jgi:uroporphyrin-3 C-methyltransferase
VNELPISPPAVPAAAPSAARPRSTRWQKLLAAALAATTLAALVLAISTRQQMRSLERELVRRQTDSQGESTEARMLAKQAQDAARDAAAKVALLDARLSEAALQRSQLEDLIQSLSRSRDENVVSDVENALRVAQQQSAITGSAEPLVATLKQADERLARYNQPRLDRVRRAIAHDIDRVKATGVVDIAALTIKLDEAVRQVEDLPLLANAERRGSPAQPAKAAVSPPQTRARNQDVWLDWLAEQGRVISARVADEIRTLVRVTRIDAPEAVLLAPEQAFFVRENLKLRLLNARLALLSRQFDTAQSDLQLAHTALERYFDRSNRRVQVTAELVQQVASQARQVSLPRPDETLAALTAAAAGR